MSEQPFGFACFSSWWGLVCILVSLRNLVGTPSRRILSVSGAGNFHAKKHDMPTGEIIFVVSPYLLMTISFVLAGRYYQTTGKALQEDEKDNYGKNIIGAPRADDDRRLRG